MRKSILLIVLLGWGTVGCSKYDFFAGVVGHTNIDERFERSMVWNRANPATKLMAESDDYTFLLGSDLHFKSNQAVLSRFLTVADARNSLFASITGDMIEPYDAGFSEFYDSISRYPSLRFMPIIGNHELYFDKQERYYELFGRTVYTFTVETSAARDLFIVLDSGNSSLGEEQMEWLIGLLVNCRPLYRHCFILSHADMVRPALSLSLSSSYKKEEQLKLYDLFDRHNVTASFFGHGHESCRKEVGGVLYVQLNPLVGHQGRSIMSEVYCAADGTFSIVELE